LLGKFFLRQLGDVNGWLADPHGTLWVAYPGYLLKLAAGARAKPQRIDLPAQPLAPTALVMDAAGQPWVAFEESIFTWAGGMWIRQPFQVAFGTSLQDIDIDGSVLWAAGYPHGLLRATLRNGRIVESSWVTAPCKQ